MVSPRCRQASRSATHPAKTVRGHSHQGLPGLEATCTCHDPSRHPQPLGKYSTTMVSTTSWPLAQGHLAVRKPSGPPTCTLVAHPSPKPRGARLPSVGALRTGGSGAPLVPQLAPRCAQGISTDALTPCTDARAQWRTSTPRSVQEHTLLRRTSGDSSTGTALVGHKIPQRY